MQTPTRLLRAGSGSAVPSPQLPALQQPVSPSSPSSPPGTNTDSLLLHFPNAPWPPPPSFQAELRRELTALGATCTASVAIRLHEGGVVAELIGLRSALSELRGLPLLDLVVLSYRVELVRSSRAQIKVPDEFAAERELLAELQAAEAKAEAMMWQAHSVNSAHDDDLLVRLSMEEHALTRVENTCAVLQRALDDYETDVKEVDPMVQSAESAGMVELTQRLWNEENAFQVAKDSRRNMLQFEKERVCTAIAATQALVEHATCLGNVAMNGHSLTLQAMLDSTAELDFDELPPEADAVALLERCAQEQQSATKMRHTIEAQVQQATLAREEARVVQLQEVLQDIATTEIAAQSQLRSSLAEEELRVAEYRQRLDAIESSRDPWDACRTIMEINAEIRELMQQQELTANAIDEAVSRGGVDAASSVTTVDMRGLAAKAAGMALEAQKLISEAGLHFGDESRKLRQSCFHWEQVADERHEHSEQLHNALQDAAPALLKEKLRIEQTKSTHWEMVAEEHEKFAAELQRDRREAMYDKSRALTQEAHVEHAVQQEQMRETVQTMAIRQVVEQAIVATMSEPDSRHSGSIDETLSAACPQDLKDAVCALATEEAVEAAKVRELSAQMDAEEAASANLRIKMTALLNDAEEQGTLRREVYQLQALAQAAQVSEASEVETAQELIEHVSATELTATEIRSHNSSLQLKLETIESDAAMWKVEVEERMRANQGLKDAAREELLQLGAAHVDLQERSEACQDLEAEVEAMFSHISLLQRRLNESHKFESGIAAELLDAQTLARRECHKELEETNFFRAEAVNCRTMEAEVAAALASHATSICEAKLSAARAMANNDEECAKVRSLTLQEAQVARALERSRGDVKEEAEKRAFDHEHWEMVLARQEGRCKVLEDVVNAQAHELAELRTHLYREEIDLAALDQETW